MRCMSNVTMSLPTGKFASIYCRHAVKGSLSSIQSYRTFCAHRSYSGAAVIKENDIVLLRKKRDPSSNPILTKSLIATGREKWEIGRRTDSIEQSKIIGKKIRDVVISKKGEEFRIHKPTLGEYITYCPRIVTPIYPADANLIVSLLDINLPRYDEECSDTKPFEIFEAGTGHGGLTLHLARAIHGANPPVPKETLPSDESRDLEENKPQKSTETFSTAMANVLSASYRIASSEDKYASKRRAIIQTLDISESHSNFARKVISNYRNGIYYRNIDFHVGTIESYLSSRLQETDQPFLEHVILDLPATHDFLEIVGKALKPNGTFITFCPSITQINSCVLKTKKDNLPFWLESVLEIGPGAGTGGRSWDVRAIKPRALLKAEQEAAKILKENEEKSKDVEQAVKNPSEILEEMEKESNGIEEEGHVQEPVTKNGEESGWEMVCRPKVGEKVVGGGFIAVWRRMEM